MAFETKAEALDDAGLAHCAKCYDLREHRELNDDGLCPVCAEPGKVHQLNPLGTDPGRERYLLETVAGSIRATRDRSGFNWSVYDAKGVFVSSGYTRGRDLAKAFEAAQAVLP